jgi:hypothetical protein
MRWSVVVFCETPHIRPIVVNNVRLSVQIELLVRNSYRLRLADRVPAKMCVSQMQRHYNLSFQLP